MKKVVYSIVPIVFIAIIIILYMGNGEKIVKRAKNETYDQIIQIDLENNYPATPSEVMELYGKIKKLMYSATFDDSDIEKLQNLIKMQIKLYDDELINYNGGEKLITLNATKNIKTFRDQKYKIIDFKKQVSSSVQFDENENILKFVNVIEYINKGDNFYMTYCLRKDKNGRWKILSYKEVEPFKIDS